MSSWHQCSSPPCNRPGQGQGQATSCTGNVKQLGLGFILYLNSRALTSITSTTETLVVAENIWTGRAGIDGITHCWPNNYADNSASRLTFPHSSQANILWVDGHVSAVKVNGLKASYFYPTWVP